MDASVAEHDTPGSIIPTATCIAAVIVDELVRHGVRHAVLCPGSRSTPLAFALAQAAHEKRLELHVRSDERTAAFLALGLSKAQLARVRTTTTAPGSTPNPLASAIVPIIVTSGSAVAHLLPALTEARMSHIPIMPLTANRPWSLVGTGASQTIDQRHIFGSHVLASLGLDTAVTSTLTLGRTPSRGEALFEMAVFSQDGNSAYVPVSDDKAALTPSVLRTRSVVARAVAAATCGRPGPGPVHVDIPFADPFVAEDTEMLARVSTWAHDDGRPHNAPWTVLGGHVQVRDERVLHIAGAGSQLDLPVPTVWEPSATPPSDPLLRVHPLAVGLWAGSDESEEIPALQDVQHVIVSGRPTLHRAISRLLARTDIRITVVGDPLDYPDVAGTAAQVATSIDCAAAPEYWVRLAIRRWGTATECVRELLENQGTSAGNDLTSLAVANEVLRFARPEDVLVVGNSNAIRDIHSCIHEWRGAELFASRGTAGIDGFLSTTFGVALAREAAQDDTSPASDTPEVKPGIPYTLGLCGDLTFLHDLTALNIGREEPTPRNVTIVVTNDSGGAIFETLEAGRDGLRPFFERVVATPHRAHLENLCRGFGWNYARATTVKELWAALHAARISAEGDVPHIDSGMTIVEAVCERDSRRAWDSWLRVAVRERDANGDDDV